MLISADSSAASSIDLQHATVRRKQVIERWLERPSRQDFQPAGQRSLSAKGLGQLISKLVVEMEHFNVQSLEGLLARATTSWIARIRGAANFDAAVVLPVGIWAASAIRGRARLPEARSLEFSFGCSRQDYRFQEVVLLLF